MPQPGPNEVQRQQFIVFVALTLAMMQLPQAQMPARINACAQHPQARQSNCMCSRAALPHAFKYCAQHPFIPFELFVPLCAHLPPASLHQTPQTMSRC
jgi:hypothetical protein